MQRYRILVVAALIASVVPALPAAAQPKQQTRAADAAPGEIVVKYRDASRSEAVRARVGARLVKKTATRAVEVIETPGSVDQAIATLETDPNVVYAEPNYLYEASAVTPNDPRYSSLWAMNKIAMPGAWTVGTGSRNVTVGVVDSGIALRHPDLAPNIWANPGESGAGKETNNRDDDGNGYIDDWRGWDWVDNDNRPSDAHGHGSHVAGTIGAKGNDSYGVAGVNWSVSLVPLRGLDHTGIGTSADIASAFRYAGSKGIDIVNASFGGTGQSVSILDAITAYPETLFIVAAGNDGSDNDIEAQYPCNYQLANLLCVAATDQYDNLAGFSNYGATSVDLAAPGVSILSTSPALSTVFTETFETDISGRWTTGGANNLWGRAVDTEGGYLSDSPAIDYLPDTDSWAATTNPISLAGQEDCKLRYALRLATEGSTDALVAEASRDASSWTRLEAWSGNTQGTWRQMNDPLQAFDGSSNVYLRFRMRSNSTLNYQGADIDNVRVHCQSTSFSGSEYRYASGTSMAAPHVAGVAALLKASTPDASVSQLVSALLTGTDTVAALSGKVTSAGRLNARRALEVLRGQSIEENPVPGPVTSPLPGNEPTGSPSPSPSPSAEPTTSPSPQPTAEPTTQPEPVPTTEPVVSTTHQRTIGLKLGGSLKAWGRVRVATGHAACATGVPVVIKRNGITIKRTTTDETGYYQVRLKDRRGRYIATAPKVETSELPAAVCAGARSPIARN